MKGKVILVVILLILVAIGYYLTAGYYSKGERAGTVSKLSERGYIFKTFEGVLNEGGYSGETGTLTPKYWEFSCKIDTTIAELQHALKTGERVTLHYQEKFFTFPWNGDTKYFITDVEFLRPVQQPAPVQQVLPERVDTVKADTTIK